MAFEALAAATTALAHIYIAITITLLSISSASAYSYHSSCNKSMCCWALNVNHWNIHNICYGCGGQDVCNYYNPPRSTHRPTFRPTKKPTNKPTGIDGWSGVQNNYCCQTTGNCPIDTPVVTHRQWLNRANRVRLTYCCQKSISSWQGDNWGWEGDGHNRRSLQELLPLCINTDMPTSSPTISPTMTPSISKLPSSTPSIFPSTSGRPSSGPSSVPSGQPSSMPSDSPSTSAQPSSQP
eukprot:scaffold23187_cov73-Skeletonema_marinoi.AAC.1